MTSVVEIPLNFRPDGGRLIITQTDTIIKPAAGLDHAVIQGGLMMSPGSSGTVQDITIQAVPQDGFRGEGLVAIYSSNWNFSRMELDGKSLDGQGFVTSDWYGNIPNNISFNDIFVHDVGTIDPSGVGYDHAFYFRSGTKIRGTNIKLLRMIGGGGLHFYSTKSEVSDIIFDQVTYDACLADNYCWGPYTHNIYVTRTLSLNVGARGHVVVGGGSYDYHVDDYVTSPKPGYGYQTNVSVDVPGAIIELTTGLDNLVSQLHYSVDKAKKTHFYKALIKLGGDWR